MKIIFSKEFDKWHEGLRDTKAKHLISIRLHRLAGGLLGDVKPVGEGVSELRIHFGAGYRVYFKKTANEITVILCGGDKSSQEHDIKRAIELARHLKD